MTGSVASLGLVTFYFKIPQHFVTCYPPNYTSVLKRYIVLLLTLFSSYIISFLQAQEDLWKTEFLTTESGLSNRFVNSIIQDHRGYTWIATNFGLNRYDGQHIEVLTRESHQLQSNTNHELFSDINGNIWVTHREVSHSPIISIDILDPVSFDIMPLIWIVYRPPFIPLILIKFSVRYVQFECKPSI